MVYTQADFWGDRKTKGFSVAVTNALMSLLPETVPVPDDPERPGKSGDAPGQQKPK